MVYMGLQTIYLEILVNFGGWRAIGLSGGE
jgi:hypothetical protein